MISLLSLDVCFFILTLPALLMIRCGPGAHQTHTQRSHPAGGHHHREVQTGICGVPYTHTEAFTAACW